jgi:LuxR family maltose regulon positive regulatory protein
MPIPILSTKLYIPPMRDDMVTRPRLIEKLNESLSGKFSLISAPAGFGKTTFLSEWVNRVERSTCWISLDEGDNDLVRFLAYFIAALQTIKPNVGASILDALQSPGLSSEKKPSIESLLTGLINEIAEKMPFFVLVIDDYHLITSSKVNHALLFLVENSPEQMDITLATRADPPWPLARMRARREMTELRADDLRFTPEEVAKFLNQIMNLNLSADHVEKLEARTEGWIAGLQMAALSLQGQKGISNFVKSFTGSNRFILDFLTEEVLEQQPDDIKDFLLKTSILRRMTAPLCDVLTGRDDSQAILDQIEQSNLFLFPLDDQRTWYRYHHLFSDLLLSHLGQGYPDQILQLNYKASEWFEKNGLIQEAVEHAIASQNVEYLASLVEKYARSAFMRGELNMVSKWLHKIPDDVKCSHPRICLDFAWTLRETNQVEELNQILNIVEGTLQSESIIAENERSSMLGEVSALRAGIVLLTDDYKRTIALCHEALEQLPENAHFVRGATLLILATAINTSGDTREALNVYPKALQACQDAGNFLMSMNTAYDYAMLQFYHGQINQAKNTLQDALNWAKMKGLGRLPAFGAHHLGLGRILFEQNELDGAEHQVKEAIKLFEKGGVELLFQSHTYLAHVYQAKGDTQNTNKSVETARSIAAGRDDIHWVDSAQQTHRAWLSCKQGDLAAAANWVDSVLADLDKQLDWLRQFQMLVIARIRLAQAAEKHDGDHLSEAIQTGEQFLGEAEKSGRTLDQIRALVILAVGFYLKGDNEMAMSHLKDAIANASPEGYYRCFLDPGPIMCEMLELIQPETQAPNFVQNLLAAFKPQSIEKRKPVLSPNSSLVEPLSDREFEVLRYLETSMSAPEIANELYVAVSTVRTHIKSIYGKLNVHRRTDAIRRAQELDLL